MNRVNCLTFIGNTITFKGRLDELKKRKDWKKFLCRFLKKLDYAWKTKNFKAKSQ